ncbi:hypothetical protein BDQ17DRAFT_1428571 [Cyathus striatus]|nr:hypothetical protein BDQ17DRAFT_1428571 [Cyathus striatus]
MDIFSTVSSAIDLAQKVITYVKEASNAFEESSKVLSEVSFLQPLLSILHSRMADPAQSNGFSMSLINAGLKTHLANCDSSLQHLAKTLEPFKRSTTKYNKLTARMKWPFKKEEIQEHLQNIEQMKSLIMLTCQASLVDFVSSSRKDLECLNIDVTATMTILGLETFGFGIAVVFAETVGKHITVDEVKDMLKEEMRSHARTYLIIDALDEYPEHSRKGLISHLRELSSVGLNILITSRNLTDIKTILGNCDSLDIYAHDEDMELYIKHRIKNSNLLTNVISRKPSLEEDIVTSMIEKADKMFLIVKLHLDSLESESSPNKIRKALNKLPRSLDETYEEVLIRIKDHPHHELTFHIFSWLKYAPRMFHVVDLQHLLALNETESEVDQDDLDDEDFIISICAGLVSISYGQGGQKTVQFVHYTVQEFFNQNPQHVFSTADLTTICLYHLLSGEYGYNEKKFRNTYHVISLFQKYISHSYEDETVRRLFGRLLADDRRAHSVGSNLVRPVECSRSTLHPLFRDPFSNNRETLELPEAVEEYINNGTTLHLVCGDPLNLCAALGLTEAVTELLDNGVNVNFRGKLTLNTPLMTAIAYNRIDVAKVLLQHPEVDVKAKDLWNKSILAYAIDLPSEQMIRTLLERDDIDVNATFDSGFLDEWSPLAYAIQEGTTLRLSMVPILLRKSNIDINCIASTGYTPLMLAVKGGHLEIFNLLLKQRRLKINIANPYSGETALVLAVLFDRLEMVKTLLAIECTECNIINKRTEYNLIDVAISEEHIVLARSLFDSGRINILPENSTAHLCLAVLENDLEAMVKISEAGERLVCTSKLARESMTFSRALHAGFNFDIIKLFIQVLIKSESGPLRVEFYTDPQLWIERGQKDGHLILRSALPREGISDEFWEFCQRESVVCIVSDTGSAINKMPPSRKSVQLPQRYDTYWFTNNGGRYDTSHKGKSYPRRYGSIQCTWEFPTQLTRHPA